MPSRNAVSMALLDVLVDGADLGASDPSIIPARVMVMSLSVGSTIFGAADAAVHSAAPSVGVRSRPVAAERHPPR